MMYIAGEFKHMTEYEWNRRRVALEVLQRPLQHHPGVPPRIAAALLHASELGQAQARAHEVQRANAALPPGLRDFYWRALRERYTAHRRTTKHELK